MAIHEEIKTVKRNLLNLNAADYKEFNDSMIMGPEVHEIVLASRPFAHTLKLNVRTEKDLGPLYDFLGKTSEDFNNQPLAVRFVCMDAFLPILEKIVG